MLALIVYISIILMSIIALYQLSLVNFLFFHTIIAFSSITVSTLIFIIAFQSRKYLESHILTFMAPSFLIIGIFNFFHAITYKGMNIFPDITSSNIPTQFYLAERYLLALSFLLLALMLTLKLKLPRKYFLLWNLFIFFYFIISFVSIFFLKNYPKSYIEGIGLTSFKIYSEYFLVLTFVISIILFFFLKVGLDSQIKQFIMLSIIFSISAELCFTLYINVYGLFNVLGHLFKLLATIMIFKSFAEVSLSRPQKIIFTNLEKDADKLKKEVDLLNYFIGMVSHELKNPLSIIDLSNNQLSNNFDSLTLDERSKLSKIITVNVKKAQLSVETLLLSTAMEWDKIVIKKELFSINDVINDLISDIQLLLQNKNILIDYKQLNANEILINGDKKRIFQILKLLLENSIKYSPSGTQISIKIEEVINQNFLKRIEKLVNISIVDNGIGIASNDIPMLFSKFFRAENAKEFDGTGLGLSIADYLTKLHNGKILVSSELAKGSTFTVQLPIDN